MNVEELKEGAEHAERKGEKTIGLTMAIVAVLLAIATLMSHRAHTEEVVLKGDANDQWNFYQAKHIRYRMYGAFADLAARQPNAQDLVAKFQKEAIDEECGKPVSTECGEHAMKDLNIQSEKSQSEKPVTAAGGSPKDGADSIQEHAREKDHETHLVGQRANYFDGAELFLEISIVLCSIALLADDKLYWRLSFITTVLGVGVALWGWFLH